LLVSYIVAEAADLDDDLPSYIRISISELNSSGDDFSSKVNTFSSMYYRP
jgi:hypothetical protein